MQTPHSPNVGSTNPIPSSAGPISPASAGPCAPDVEPSAAGSFPGLTAAQDLALIEVAAGQSDRDVADRIGVSHMTVYRWRKQCPAFIAALNALRAQAMENARDRILALAAKAAQTVEKAMDKGDARTAIILLKSLGSLNPPAPGPESPDDAKLVARTDEIERMSTLVRRYMDTYHANSEAKRLEQMNMPESERLLNPK
jgi:transposase-like protein